MTHLHPPDEIELSYADGVLEYEERVDVSEMPEEVVDGYMERTKNAAMGLGGNIDDITVERENGSVRMAYEVARTPTETLQIGALELLLMVDGLGGDVDRVWHLVKAMGPSSERLQPAAAGKDAGLPHGGDDAPD